MKKVLVVVDMQNDFIDGSLGTKEAEAIVDAVAEEIRKDYDLIIATRDTHDENYLNTNEGKHLPVVHCVRDSKGWQIADKVEKALKEKENVSVLNKPTFGSEEIVKVFIAVSKALFIMHSQSYTQSSTVSQSISSISPTPFFQGARYYMVNIS